jgi:hypothetical protein
MIAKVALQVSFLGECEITSLYFAFERLLKGMHSHVIVELVEVEVNCSALMASILINHMALEHPVVGFLPLLIHDVVEQVVFAVRDRRLKPEELWVDFASIDNSHFLVGVYLVLGDKARIKEFLNRNPWNRSQNLFVLDDVIVADLNVAFGIFLE